MTRLQMSERFASFVVRTWWLWAAGWLLTTLAVWLSAPRIPTLLKDDATGFLPRDLPSQRALALLREEFPDRPAGSRAVIVFAHPGGLTAADHEWMARLSSALANQSTEQGWSVTSAELAFFLKPLLESADGECAIIVVDLSAGMLTQNTVNRVHAIESEIRSSKIPPGLEIHITGNAAMGALIDAGAKRDIDRTTLWAIGAVAAILLFVYRSPVAMLLPLVTIAVALLTSLGIVGWAAKFGWPLNGLVQMFIVVMVVGCGVDYCLYLFVRFVEEMRIPDNSERRSDSEGSTLTPAPLPERERGDALTQAATDGALQRALAKSAGAILAGAATVAAGLTTLALGRNRDYYTSGPTIALCIAIATLSVLTLAPALIRLMGKRLLPRRLLSGAGSHTSVWARAARWVTHQPAIVLILSLSLLSPLAILSTRLSPLYDALEEFPADSTFVRGAKLYYAHFFGGRAVSEMTVLLSGDARLDAPESAPQIKSSLGQVHSALGEQFPLVYQRDLADALGLSRGTQTTRGDAHSFAAAFEKLAGTVYIGRSGKTMRIDLGFFVEPRSVAAMDMVESVREAVFRAIEHSGIARSIGASTIGVEIGGEPAFYADQRALRDRDIKVIAIGAIATILAILYLLVRSLRQAVILVAATVLTFYATYGATWFIVHHVYGLPGLNWKLSFLLFIIILSLGQDYNIFVVSRIAEEMKTHPPREAVENAIRQTGRVVSSCGIIMAATFASMFSGSLMLMKEFAIALSLGILMDTFIVRPLLVPALIVLLRAWPRREFHASGEVRAG